MAVRKLLVKPRNKYAAEEMIAWADGSGLWLSRRPTDRPNVNRLTQHVIHIGPKRARALAHWILEVFPE